MPHKKRIQCLTVVSYDKCESQQSYFEISLCSCDVISSSCSRSTERSLFLCGFPTPSPLWLYHYFKIGNLTSTVQSAPVLCWLTRGSCYWERGVTPGTSQCWSSFTHPVKNNFCGDFIMKQGFYFCR